MAKNSTRRAAALVISVLAGAALLSGCSKGSTVSAGAATTGPSATAAPVVQKTCAQHLAGADTDRQSEVDSTTSAMSLPSGGSSLSTKVDAGCQANPDSTFSSVLRDQACATSSTAGSLPSAGTPTSDAPPTSAPGAFRLDPRPVGLAVGHPARAGGGHGGGKSSGGKSSGGGSSGGGSSSGSSHSSHSSGAGSSSGSHSSSSHSSGSDNGSSGGCG